ncbi:nucleotidyltransferase family protein [Alicyclobacillus dauci]|uniref:Nucleotidyltransferase family protein n=1 Tax=Alicyclobacillus dauci TaxID=1475485 RepID=A0ABY6Z4K1_9BACL|nr:nucleotidyltransferase family protein [Alicyclobacillus dauci]WAH37757.1 nucleotidyltransferase family protein [Alicyclobacillus dauci]
MAGGVWAVIFAAGAARRMGQQKLLLEMPDGRPIIRCVAEAAVASAVDGVIVVVSSDSDRIRAAITDLPVSIAENPKAADGQSSSLQVGVEELQRVGAAAGIFLLGDQPEVETTSIDALVHRYLQRRSKLIQVRYRGEFGHPVLFDEELYPELLACTGDEGGRRVVRKYQAHRVVVDVDRAAPPDIDTRDDYEALLSRLRSRR